MYVWLNGHFVGYAEDSFTPSDFDLHSIGSGRKEMFWLWRYTSIPQLLIWKIRIFSRFSGIFRNVVLYAKPELHVEDLWAKPVLETNGKTGSFSMELTVSARDAAADKTGQLGSVSWRIVRKGTDDIRGAGTVLIEGGKKSISRFHPRPFQTFVPGAMRSIPLSVGDPCKKCPGRDRGDRSL